MIISATTFYTVALVLLELLVYYFIKATRWHYFWMHAVPIYHVFTVPGVIVYLTNCTITFSDVEVLVGVVFTP